MNDIEINNDGYWKFHEINNDFILLNRSLEYDKKKTTYDILGPYWSLCVGQIQSGTIEMLIDGKVALTLNSKETYATYLPPFSIVHFNLLNIHQKCQYLISKKKIPKLPNKAIHFIPPSLQMPCTENDIINFIANGNKTITVESSSAPTAIAQKIKKKLDENCSNNLKLEELSRELGISQTLLGRYLKKSFGISPSDYRKHIKIMNSTIQLFQSKTISAVSQDNGFNDLSRFNKQFKQLTRFTPSQLQHKSRKTPRRLQIN